MDSQVIEFLGMPNSGKSTVIKNVSKLLVNKGYPTMIISEGARNSTIEPKGGYLYNLSGLLSTTASIIGNLGNSSILLVDRGPTDMMIFSKVLYKNNYLSKSESSRLKDISKNLSNLVTDYILFTAKATTSLRRDEKHSKDKVGIVMNTKFLDDLQKEYILLKKKALGTVDSETNSLDDITTHCEKLIVSGKI